VSAHTKKATQSKDGNYFVKKSEKYQPQFEDQYNVIQEFHDNFIEKPPAIQKEFIRFEYVRKNPKYFRDFSELYNVEGTEISPETFRVFWDRIQCGKKFNTFKELYMKMLREWMLKDIYFPLNPINFHPDIKYQTIKQGIHVIVKRIVKGKLEILFKDEWIEENEIIKGDKFYIRYIREKGNERTHFLSRSVSIDKNIENEQKQWSREIDKWELDETGEVVGVDDNICETHSLYYPVSVEYENQNKKRVDLIEFVVKSKAYCSVKVTPILEQEKYGVCNRSIVDEIKMNSPLVPENILHEEYPKNADIWSDHHFWTSDDNQNLQWDVDNWSVFAVNVNYSKTEIMKEFEKNLDNLLKSKISFNYKPHLKNLRAYDLKIYDPKLTYPKIASDINYHLDNCNLNIIERPKTESEYNPTYKKKSETLARNIKRLIENTEEYINSKFKNIS